MSIQTGAVVVGYDSSETSQQAVDWAAAEATRRQRPLVVVHAAVFPYSDLAVFGGGPSPHEIAEQSARRVAEEGAERARKRVSGISVEAQAVMQNPSVALQSMSKDASMVVIGNRGYGRLGGALLGSVAFAIAGHAASPVVVVRGDAERHEGPEHPVVVGYDGSEHSGIALDRAADVAVETAAELRIVVAWSSPEANPWSSEYLVDPQYQDKIKDRAEQDAQQLAEQAVSRVTNRLSDVVVDQIIQEGPAQQVIVENAQAAGRIVVGARGRGGLPSLLLGSVSRGVIHRADCPVEIIR